MATRAVGPSWLGIGAQNSGGNWFCRLLCEHPEVMEVRGDQRLLLGALNGRLGASERREYLARFAGPGYRGEFRSAYMRALWMPEVVAELLAPESPIFVVLRDPIDRFLADLARERRRPDLPGPEPSTQLRSWGRRFVSAQWAGMYAALLSAWERVFGDRICVTQYEVLVDQPQQELNRLWATLGLAPVSIGTPRPPRDEHAPADVNVAQLVQSLHHLYEPQVERLARWNIDRSLWRHFN